MLTGPDAIGVAGGKPLPIYLEGRVIPLADAVGRELGLKFNEVVRGVVEARAETLLLKLNGREVELPAQLKFRPGEVLWLRYTEMGRGMVLVQQAGPGAVAGGAAGVAGQGAAGAAGLPGPIAAPPPVGGLSPAVASLFLRPADFSGLLSLLSGAAFVGLAQRAQSGASSVGTNALGQWLSQRPAMGRLSADGVRQALRASGLFTESALGKGGAIPGDLKLAMRQAVLQMQTEMVSGLREQLESGLHELESAQADALGVSAQRDLGFSFIIPFRDADPVLVSFFRPRRSPQEPNPPAVVNLYTRSDTLGEVWMKTVIEVSDTISLTMWAEREDLAKRAREAVGELEDEMTSAGLVLKSMVVLHGRRPEEGVAVEARTGAVLDLKA
jgi:hypothetical protein